LAELIVAADGSGSHRTVRSAIDAASGDERVTIRVRPGRYREVVRVTGAKPPISLVGATGDPRDVVITFDNANRTLRSDGTPLGTSGSATLTVEADGFEARDLTVENAYRRDPDPAVRDQQAVALKVEADRVVVRNVRLIGRQDTLYANAPDGRLARQYFRDCHIEGDVDFIFGSATAVFDRCRIRALARAGRACVTAASTAETTRYGFLIVRSRIETAAPTVRLGRPWHPGGDPHAIAQVAIRETWLDAGIAAEPWTDMSGFSWKDARLAEFRNTGPGAAVNASRPQLAAADASSFTPRAYLAGADGWDPATQR
jgi:pectin methylesterase-like acyl-CoA thioesterase